MLDGRVGLCEVEGEINLPCAAVQLLKIDLSAPSENVVHADGIFRLDFAIRPHRRRASVRFMDRWHTDRFESAGSLFLMPPGEAMQIRSATGVQRSLVCQLSVHHLETLLDLRFGITDRSLEAGLDIERPALRGLLSRLGEEVRAPGIASEIMVEALALQIAVELKRFYSGLEDCRETGALSAWRLRLIDERLGSDDAPPSIAELAGLCGLSARQLARSFQASRGVSVGHFLIEHRIGRAKQRLAAAETVKQVAYSVGFSSPSSFCSAFRRTTGITPGEFRAAAGLRRRDYSLSAV